MIELQIKEKDRILIIAPHPDDETIGTGGLIGRYASQCDVWLLTDGSMGGVEGQEPRQVAEIRRNEFDNAMRLAGVNNYRIFRVKDRSLSMHTDILAREDFRQYRMIFVTGESDSHPDHVSAYMALTQAVNNGAKLNPDVEIYQYEVTAPLPEISHYLDYTDIISQKKAMIECYPSQLDQADYYSIALSLDQFRASVLGKRNHYYETYKKVELNGKVAPVVVENLMLKRQKEKLDLLLWCYDKWLGMELSGKPISYKLKEEVGEKVWIYGCGILGKSIDKAMTKAGITVVGYIDKFVLRSEDIKRTILNPNDVKENERGYPVIVSAVFEYELIKSELEKKGYSNLLSFAELLREMM